MLAAGCAGAPLPPLPDDPAATLALVRSRLEAGPARDPELASRILQTLDQEALTRTEQELFAYLRAEALFQTGDEWEAFRQIREFQDEHRFSEFAPRVEDLHFRIGATLIQSESGGFLFGSDQDDGEIVLDEFVERYPTSPHTDDGLRLLGELAADEERWFDAQRRFERLIQEHPDSEWRALAEYRRVMALHAQLLGPAYDLPSMLQTRNELRDYLAAGPERPEFREGAATALAEVKDWVARRRLLDADFYRTVGNEYGERFHLELLVADSPGHPLVEVARRRLAAMEAGS